MVRCFETTTIIHVEGSIDPKRDIETIDLELILSDMEVLERRIDKTKKMLKADKKYQAELDFLERVYQAWRLASLPAAWNAPRRRRDSLHREPADQQAHYLRRQHERGRLPGRRGKTTSISRWCRNLPQAEHAAVLPICAEIEAEISGMEPEEKSLFLAVMGLEESGLDRLIQACYSLLGLISYLTAANRRSGPGPLKEEPRPPSRRENPLGL